MEKLNPELADEVMFEAFKKRIIERIQKVKFTDQNNDIAFFCTELEFCEKCNENHSHFRVMMNLDEIGIADIIKLLSTELLARTLGLPSPNSVNPKHN